MTEQNTRAGILMMATATVVFALQDGISRHLAADYNVYMVTTIRFWFFALFVLALAARSRGGLRGSLTTRFPKLQLLRSALLVGQVLVMVQSFVYLGLVSSHAVLTCYPLLVAALSGPILGERVGWRRWTAIAIGALGVLVILQPGRGTFSPLALIPLLAAIMFAIYALVTRYVAKEDSAMVSFSLTGLFGAVLITPLGLWHWQPMTAPDWIWMAVLCCTGVIGHGALIRAYDLAEASAVQPFSYLQLVWISVIGVFVFGETLAAHMILGTVIVASAGLFTLIRSRRVAVSDPAAPH